MYLVNGGESITFALIVRRICGISKNIEAYYLIPFDEYLEQYDRSVVLHRQFDEFGVFDERLEIAKSILCTYVWMVVKTKENVLLYLSNFKTYS
jgi:hypothetical protein